MLHKRDIEEMNNFVLLILVLVSLAGATLATTSETSEKVDSNTPVAITEDISTSDSASEIDEEDEEDDDEAKETTSLCSINTVALDARINSIIDKSLASQPSKPLLVQELCRTNPSFHSCGVALL